MRVRVLPVNIGGRPGYDLVVLDDGATVEDYLQAVEYAIERLPLSRERGKSDACRGCDRCCGERIPLTSIDMDRLYRHLADKPEKTLAWHETLERYAHVLVDGPAVDITVRLTEEGRCVFLDPTSRLCQVYPDRPLVCRTYICCPQTSRARLLREWIVNAGEDELVRRWLENAVQRGVEPVMHEAYQPAVSIEDWASNPFAGKSDYSEVLLRDICPPSLWGQLWQGTP